MGRNEQRQVKNKAKQNCSQPPPLAAPELTWKPPNVCICGVLSRSDISVANYYRGKDMSGVCRREGSAGADSIFRTSGPLSPCRPGAEEQQNQGNVTSPSVERQLRRLGGTREDSPHRILSLAASVSPWALSVFSLGVNSDS